MALLGWWWVAAEALGGRGQVVEPPPGGVDVVIVAGCPTEPDGRLSGCQWRRALWATHLYEQGLARHFITSGGAAYTPYVEATSIARGMEALGVPSSVIYHETQALHTDQNTGYGLAMARALGFETVGMASDPGHSGAMCSMAVRWDWDCTDFPMDYEIVHPRTLSLPAVEVDPIPRDQWLAEHRERRMATRRRYNSVRYYTGVILKATLTGSRPPKPPRPEPSLFDVLGAQSP